VSARSEATHVRVRFAPSPTGHLHVGNARTALFNWLFARRQGGVFVLRIEDTDAERSTAASEQAIYDDLRWLGLDWDEGPGTGGLFGPYRQSERRAMHDEAARALLGSGAAYRCFCSKERLDAEREAQRAAGLPPRYGGRCRDVSPAESARRAGQEPFAVRFRVAADRVVFTDLIRGAVEFPATQIGDMVLVRADGLPTYNFAVVLDDLGMKITHVIRGEDHVSNTPRQILLYAALGAQPPVFAHVSMVLGPDGAPLSKRHGASSLADFRESGFLPEALLNYLALLGWSPPEGKEILPAREIAALFSLEKVGHAAAMFDMKKLAWLNAHYLREAPAARLLSDCRKALAASGLVPPSAGPPEMEEWIGRALQTYTGQMETLADAPAALRPLLRFTDHLEHDASAAAALAGLAGEPRSVEVMERFADLVESRHPPLLSDKESFRGVAAEVGRTLALKGRPLYHAIRVAVSAADAGPELDRLVPLIDDAVVGNLPLPGPAIPSCAARARLVARRLRADR